LLRCLGRELLHSIQSDWCCMLFVFVHVLGGVTALAVNSFGLVSGHAPPFFILRSGSAGTMTAPPCQLIHTVAIACIALVGKVSLSSVATLDAGSLCS